MLINRAPRLKSARREQTLADNAEIVYKISEFYAPNSAAGHRYDDAAFGIAWPLPVTVISERDLSWSAFNADPPVLSISQPLLASQ